MASNGKGHGIHSPFVFELVSKALKQPVPATLKFIENRRRHLLRDHRFIWMEDYGAGSRTVNGHKRKVSDIARSSLKPQKYAELLYKLVHYYQPHHVLELGTSLGITTAYLSAAAPQLTTVEGAPAVASIANDFFEQAQLKQIQLTVGNFDVVLNDDFLKQVQPDMVYIDGNHRKEPTIRYFNLLLPYMQEDAWIVFDDIHWSREMEEAWEYIKAHEAVTLSLDFFFIGIVFFKKSFLVKQHYTIRY
jgi:predicted O-methyltransferase YrrM